MDYTEKEKEFLKLLEKRIGKKIGGVRYRRKEFRKMSKKALKKYRDGLQDLLYWRLNLDNIDLFSTEEDIFRTKLLEENLEIADELLGKSDPEA